MKTLEKLWSIADNESERTNHDLRSVFAPIGLRLFCPLINKYYKSTPINSSTFADTGGDGNHFSLLLLKGEISEDSPVVMTVPMNFGKENLIVGESLQEFLCLGEQIGYFVLEELIYNEAKAIKFLEHPKDFINQEYGADLSGNFPPASFRKQENLLSILRENFRLQSWRNIKSRLDELQNRYMGMLEFQGKST